MKCRKCKNEYDIKDFSWCHSQDAGKLTPVGICDYCIGLKERPAPVDEDDQMDLDLEEVVAEVVEELGEDD